MKDYTITLRRAMPVIFFLVAVLFWERRIQVGPPLLTMALLWAWADWTDRSENDTTDD